jgi:dTDP-4-dehydrorhamnose reductase
MRVYLTGATGFVGSNVAAAFAERGAELFCPVRATEPPAGAPYDWATVDLTDRSAVARSVADVRPDAIVHAAILNDPAAMAADPRGAWAAYAGATRHLVDAGNAAGAHVVLVSTDWVFDGTRGPAAEDEPPNPICRYGFLKAASELVVTERAERGTVARIAAVQGVHRARPAAPRSQDHGLGYLAASVVDALRDGRAFTVWESDAINVLATPTLASDAAALLWRVLEREATGILHCCGGEHADRATLARRVAEAFDLDPGLVRTGPPPSPPREPVPHDTRLDASATAAALDVELPGLDTQLARLRHEMEDAACRTT